MSYAKASGQPDTGGGRWLAAMAIATGMAMAGSVGLAGCASPPAVDGLIETAEQVMAAERAAIEADAERAQLALAAQRESLEAAFDADLQQRESLDHDWVMTGVRAYVEAREGIVRHEAELEAAYATRQRNLRLAGDALQRARLLLATQDGLFDRVPDVRAYLHAEHERYQQEVE